MKIIYNSIFPVKGYVAINLFGIVFVRKGYKPISARTANHEAIHTAQMREMLYLFFYIWYGVEWIIRLMQYRNRNDAYRNISFEREAYANERALTYLKTRSVFRFYQYINKKQ